MSNSDVLQELRALQSGVYSGQISVEQAASSFERLTLMLTGITTQDERALVSMVNDIERIRFTRLPESQMGAVNDVLIRADGVFERYA